MGNNGLPQLNMNGGMNIPNPLAQFANATGLSSIADNLNQSPLVVGARNVISDMVNPLNLANAPKQAAQVGQSFQSENQQYAQNQAKVRQLLNKPTRTPEETQFVTQNMPIVTAPMGVIGGADALLGNHFVNNTPLSSTYKSGMGNFSPTDTPSDAQYAQTSPNYPDNHEIPPNTPPAGGKPMISSVQQPLEGGPSGEANPIPPNPARTRTFAIPDNLPSDELQSNQLRNIQIDGQDIKTPNQVAQINSTLNGYGITGTPTEQLQSTNDQIGKLAKTASKIVSDQGGAISKQDMINAYARQLSLSPSIPDAVRPQIPTVATQSIDDVYNRALGGTATQGVTGEAPDNIPGSVFQKMKQIWSGDAASTYDQTDPTKWTMRQVLSRSGRDIANNFLDAKYPAASVLNNDMQDLYNAQPSLIKGANAESGAAAKAAEQPKQGFLGKLLSTKAGQVTAGLGASIGATGLIAGGVYGLNSANPGTSPDDLAINGAGNGGNNILPQANAQPNQNAAQKPQGGQPQSSGNNNINGTGGSGAIHSTNIPQGPTNVNDLETDFNKIQPTNGQYAVPNIYNIKDANGQPVAVNEGEIRKQNQVIQNYLAAHPNDPVAQARASAASSVLGQVSDASKPLIQTYNKASSTMNIIHNAQAYLDNKNPGIFGEPNVLDAFQVGPVGIQGLQGGLNSNYRTMLQDFNAIQSAYPELHLDMSNVGSKEAAKAALDNAAKQILANLNQQVKSTSISSPDMSFSPQTQSAGIQGTQNPPVPPAGLPAAQGGGLPQPPSGSYQFTAPNPMFQLNPLGQ